MFYMYKINIIFNTFNLQTDSIRDEHPALFSKFVPDSPSSQGCRRCDGQSLPVYAYAPDT